MIIWQSPAPQASRLVRSLFLATAIVIATWARPSVSPAATTAVVGNTLSSPVYVNLYWDATWDVDNPSLPKASLDMFTAAMVASSYFGGLAEYGVGSASFAGGFLPAASCPQKAPSSVGFYDPINASIIGFLNCELQKGGIPQGPQVVYNLILPSGSLESDLFGNRTVCGSTSPASAWHFHQTPYTPEAVAGIALVTATGGVPSLETVLGVLAALHGGPLYTIESADSRCGSFTNNLLHEMVEAASDPFPPPSVVLGGGGGEIADLCAGVLASSRFVPPSQPFAALGTFTTATNIRIPQYWSNAGQRCITGFTNPAIPTVGTVTFATGSYPLNPGSYSFTITGRGFGTLSAPTVPTLLPNIEFQDDTRHTRMGNALNSDPLGIQIAAWTDTSITVTGATGGDSYSFWVCNPASGLCGWGVMPPAVYAVNPGGASCLSSPPVIATVTGANFYSVRNVRLDGNPGLSFTPQSLSQLTATIPVALGLHAITVDAFGGSSVARGPNFVVTPAISASVSPVAPLTDSVTVTSCGTPLGGASVSVSGQPTNTAVTNGSGVAVVTHLPCYAPGSIVPKVGQPTAPVRIPVACAGIVSKAGYQSFNTALP